jgi:hypothetical protein
MDLPNTAKRLLHTIVHRCICIYNKCMYMQMALEGSSRTFDHCAAAASKATEEPRSAALAQPPAISAALAAVITLVEWIYMRVLSCMHIHIHIYIYT